jgi:aspartate carbamoyltransferase catalytic subunit
MMKDLISIDDLSLAQLKDYLSRAARIEAVPAREKAQLLSGQVLMVMFFEPSTRTRLSFEAAMCRLGGSAIGFSDTSCTSVVKGESLADTIHTVERYADVMVIRHPKEGTARLASQLSRLPVINVGDGANQHPTQTLLDLYTIQKFFGQIDRLKIALAGDLKYSRTIHSLIRALMMFEEVEFVLVSPQSLALPHYLRRAEGTRQATFHETADISEAIATCDVVYMTRIQKERFPDLVEYEKVKDAYCVDAEMLEVAQEHMKILHPLPRVNEISPEVDNTPHAGYFEQVENGLIMRQAILLHLLGVER